MPLSFLTADSSHDEQPDGDVLPHPYPDQWTRPYRPGPYRVAAAALLLMLASYLLFASLIVGLSGELHGAGVIVAATAGVIAFTLRILRTGVWVSADGLRHVRLLYTTTLPWARIQEVRTSQQPVRWLGLPRTVQGQALVLTPAHGGETRVLLTDHNADFLGRVEAFDMAADAIEDWADPAR
ncbi:PH domain-containing protein [Wenjunlia tyrosinilytica]|uniref:PH domain-containing protein n=1 Tax=Wenjunlia tyrosinilytica TaxID=1544741 RepID=UPI00166530ED|nr:PH domain-containing protein [Wenjunlia tyrosinilytica]